MAEFSEHVILQPVVAANGTAMTAAISVISDHNREIKEKATKKNTDPQWIKIKMFIFIFQYFFITFSLQSELVLILPFLMIFQRSDQFKNISKLLFEIYILLITFCFFHKNLHIFKKQFTYIFKEETLRTMKNVTSLENQNSPSCDICNFFSTTYFLIKNEMRS